jgi:hypothetical protein
MATVRHLGLFPFCPGPYPPQLIYADENYVDSLDLITGDGGDLPFKMPIRLAARMWWTVKHWKISFNYSAYNDLSNDQAPYQSVDFYDAGSYVEVDSFDLVFDTKTDMFPNYYVHSQLAASERDLICQTDTPYNGEFVRMKKQVTFSGDITGPNPPVPTGPVSYERDINVFFLTVDDNQGSGFELPFYHLDKNDAEYGSQLWANCKLTISVANNSFWTSDYLTQDNAYEGPTETATLSLLGNNFEFSIKRRFELGGDGLDTESISDLRIEPSEFWEYDPGDGLGPIYDKTTGAQLRPFPD